MNKVNQENIDKLIKQWADEEASRNKVVVFFEDLYIKLSNIKTIFRDVKHGFSNLWYYKGIIWMDRNWDWNYILGLELAKLKRVEAHLEVVEHVDTKDKLASVKKMIGYLADITDYPDELVDYEYLEAVKNEYFKLKSECLFGLWD